MGSAGGFVMARGPQIVSREEVAEADRHVADQVLAVFGRIRGPFSILLHSPDLAELLLPMVPFARKGNIVDAKSRFVGILATVREKEAAYVWSAQVRVARESGLDEDAIGVLRARGPLSDLRPDQREVADFARQLVLNNKVEQAAFDTLQKKYGTKWLVELTGIMSFYGALCGVVNAFEVPVPDAGDDRF